MFLLEGNNCSYSFSVLMKVITEKVEQYVIKVWETFYINQINLNFVFVLGENETFKDLSFLYT